MDHGLSAYCSRPKPMVAPILPSGIEVEILSNRQTREQRKGPENWR